MPPVIASQCVRYTVFGSIFDNKWNTIWDVEINEGRPAAESKIVTKGEQILDAYALHILPLEENQWTVQGVRWLDLDSLNGGTGVITDTPTGTFPATGGSASQGSPANCCALVVKQTTGGRATRNGRSYHVAPTMAAVDSNNSNLLSAAGQSALETAYDAFFTKLNEPISGIDCQAVVVSVDKAGTVRINPVTSLSVQSQLASQRRRLRD